MVKIRDSRSLDIFSARPSVRVKKLIMFGRLLKEISAASKTELINKTDEYKHALGEWAHTE